MNKINGIYMAVLDTASKQRLALLGLTHPYHYNHHVTLAYRPTISQDEYYRPLIGNAYEAVLILMKTDDKGQAVKVAGSIPSVNKHAHVTLSCASGVNPAYSNELLDKDGGNIKTIYLSGTIRGVVVFDEFQQ